MALHTYLLSGDQHLQLQPSRHCAGGYIDLMLLMRLCLVYRAEWTRWVRVCVYIPAVLLLVARLSNITNTMIHIIPLVFSQDVLKGVEVIVWHDAGAQAEFFMQILNNA